MRKNYFIISMLFTLTSLIFFWIGIKYGFTVDFVNIIKPISIFQYSTFLAFVFALNAFKENLQKVSSKDFWLTVGFFVAMASFYEVFFNFFYWFSLYSFYGLGANLDAVTNVISAPRTNLFNITNFLNVTNQQTLEKTGLYPLSLNIASKIVVLIFFCSLYWIYFFHDLKKEERLKD